MLRAKHLVLLVLLAAAGHACASESDGSSSGAHAADNDTGATAQVERRLQQLASPYVDPSGVVGKAVGLVVGVSSPEVRTVVGFGASSKGGSTPPGADSIFEIGSVTKVYTGVLLGIAIDRGQLRLDDPIDPFFPAGAPRHGTRSITILDLATHTSGLPAMPTNLPRSEPGNPAAGYDAEDLADFMASHHLSRPPGSTFSYSNVGAGALGYLLVQASGSSSYEALVQRKIADRLGVNDTSIALSAEQQTRRVQGYRNARPAPDNSIGEPLQGSGALRSTASDVLSFVEAALGTGDPELVAAWQRALHPRRPSPFGDRAHTGFLITIEETQGRTVYSKNGQTAGFSAQIIFTTEPPVAVVLLANTGELANTGALRDLGVEMLTELLPDSDSD